jgi:hypothetical protein
MKRVRFEREFWFANDDIISVRAVAGWIGKTVNLVADFESGYAYRVPPLLRIVPPRMSGNL